MEYLVTQRNIYKYKAPERENVYYILTRKRFEELGLMKEIQENGNKDINTKFIIQQKKILAQYTIQKMHLEQKKIQVGYYIANNKIYTNSNTNVDIEFILSTTSYTNGSVRSRNKICWK